MKNIKTLTLGIIIGAVATLSITALAEYITTPNPYPVKVNGQEVQVEGYNINDSTYFKMRDVADAVGGFSVDFADNTIIVNTDRGEGVPIPTPVPTSTDAPDTEPVAVKNTPNPKLSLYRYGGDKYNPYAHIDEHTFTSDGLLIETLEDGNEYVYTGDIETVYDFKEKYKFVAGHITDTDYNVILDNIAIAPENVKNNNVYIELSYYENTLLNWLQIHCK